ncbi:MAG: 16S rRNA (cytosine(1402)-N(4))-methyltransferase RsmH [Desulfovibrio sp.]
MSVDPASVHTSVQLTEIIEWLRPTGGKRYLDGTLGMAGHSRTILETARKSGSDAELVGLDRDEQALELARTRLEGFEDQINLFHMPFSDFESALDELGWDTIDGAMLDLGVSSLQLDRAERGFSFREDGPLDMRMDPSSGMPPASEIVNTYKHGELAKIIREYGGDPMAGKIASAILRARDEEPITGTLRLAKVVELAYPPKMRRTARNHPATRTFQALRIAVNRELEELETFLDGIIDRLSPGARVCIISFHSLEDRIVKHTFKRLQKGCICPPRQMFCTCEKQPTIKILTKKPQIPTDEEIAVNPRSRSARLRVAERLEDEQPAD